MAIARMRKLLLVGATDERSKLMRQLQKFGCIELVQIGELDGTSEVRDQEYNDYVAEKLQRISFAFDTVKRIKITYNKHIKSGAINYKPVKKPLLAQKPEIDFDAFSKTDENSEPIFEKISYMDGLNTRLNKLHSSVTELMNLRAQLMPYSEVNARIGDVKSTKNTVAFLGTVGANKLSKLTMRIDETEYAAAVTYTVRPQTVVAVICHRISQETVGEILADAEFTACPVTADVTAGEKIKLINEELEKLRRNELQLAEELLSYDDILADCRLLHDYYSAELHKAAAMEGTRKTRTCYVMEGWTPVEKQDNVSEILEKSDMHLSYSFRDPIEGETPPTLVYSSRLAEPYESVTNMFSVPNYNEMNPNTFVGIFFFIFFGMMMADVGYGVLIVLATSIALAVTKPRRGEGSLYKVLLMGGISTLIWGVLFGSYFGESFLPPILFNPIESPINMLFLSLGLGAVQMLFGMGLNAYSLFKQKRPLDAVFGTFSWYALVLGLALAFAFKVQAVKITGYILLGLGIAGMLAAGALHKKGAGKVIGALGNLYGIVNFFSDLLSYTRLFGLGLATGVIGMVFNQIAGVMADILPIIGYVLAAVVIVVGHLFNVAINALGAYVHDSRLQFVEFFSKFYSGGGRLFKPLGANMKYYNFKEEVK